MKRSGLKDRRCKIVLVYSIRFFKDLISRGFPSSASNDFKWNTLYTKLFSNSCGKILHQFYITLIILAVHESYINFRVFKFTWEPKAWAKYLRFCHTGCWKKKLLRCNAFNFLRKHFGKGVKNLFLKSNTLYIKLNVSQVPVDLIEKMTTKFQTNCIRNYRRY